MKYLKVFETEPLQNAFRNSQNYIEPHVSCLINGGNLKYNIYTSKEKPFLSKPFTIKALDSGDLTWNLESRTLLYSKNNGEWTTMDSSTTISMLAGDEVAFKGENDTYWSCTIVTTMNFDVFGNIMSLTDGDDYETANTVNENAFRGGLFDNTNNNEYGVVNAKYLMLPAMNLGTRCYLNMFRHCANLLTAPKLPAVVLANRCYCQLFQDCVNLIEPPELPATTLAESCYQSMFYNCTNLKYAPELPARTLANTCYYGMFWGCTSITTAPELPVTSLTEGCYQAMFKECSSLTEAPELPATTLAANCYWAMFTDCTGLTIAPELPATTLAEGCYKSMFLNCTSITTASDLLAEHLASGCYETMFSGCTNLNYIKCLAHDQFSETYTKNWVKDVSPTGTFVKWCCTVMPAKSDDTIPENWTVSCEGDCES